MKHKVKHKSNKTNKGTKVDDPTVLRINQTARLAAQKARSVVGTGKHSQDSDSSGEPPIFRTAGPEGLGKKPNALNHLLWSSPAQAGSGSGVRTGERRQGNGSFEKTSSEDRLWSSPAQAGSGSGVKRETPATLVQAGQANWSKNVQERNAVRKDAMDAGKAKWSVSVNERNEAKQALVQAGQANWSKNVQERNAVRKDAMDAGKAKWSVSVNERNEAKQALVQAGQANWSKNVQERNAQKKDVVNKIYAGKSQKEVEQLNNFFKMQVANDASLAQRGQQTKAKQNFDSMLKRQAAASVQAKADREDNDWARSTLMKKPSLSTKKPSKPPVATGGYSRGNSNGYDEVYKPKPVVYPPPKTYRPGVNTPRAI